MRMPGMSGAELLEVVQREYPDTIRLILSGQAETESVMKALGVSHQFLSKPCDADILQGTIARAFTLRDLAGNPAVKTLVARINKLPTLPATYQKLVECLKSPNADMDDVAKIISRDPSMSARLLKVVNSAYFGLAKPVADVARAGALLGLDRIMALVLGQGMFSGGEVPQVRGFSLEALWAHSLATATAAHRIAIDEELDKEQVAAAFLAGMLHDIGKLVLAMGVPDEYARVLELARGRPGSERELETLELQAAHTDVGAYLVGSLGPAQHHRRGHRLPRRPGAVDRPVRPAGHRARRRPHRASPGDRRSARAGAAPEFRLPREERPRRPLERVARDVRRAPSPKEVRRERPRPVRRRRTQRARRHPPPAAQSRRTRDGDQRRRRASTSSRRRARSPWWSPTCACRRWTARASSPR